ncbi:helix-turn-helix domain-containing protein [Streptomyces asoensis]|uniref:helix-turn-helix domain-containing protein n=1 Tax=Streptomyces asoensis TaxID=249586 RepID=UPI0037AB13C6
MSATEFAELLRELKERSGLSYGTLSKRLHMSTSTLHRYCNGDAVPTDYAPVERLARLCKASPQELVELHRRWVLADAVRGRKPEPRGTAGTAASGTGPGAVDAQDTPAAGAESADARGAEGAQAGGAAGAGGAEGAQAGGAGGVEGAGGGGGRRVRRTLVLAGAGAAAALGSVVLALALTLPGGGSGDGDDGRAAGSGTSVQGRGTQGTPSSPASASASVSVKPSASAPAAGPASPSASAAASSAAPGTDAGAGDSVPLTVSTRPYAWIDPCSQHYLIERGPDRVGPPPVEQDAPAWVARHRAVSAGEQFVQITVQGTGAETVVVESLTVRTVAKAAPLAWNDYAMGYPGVGCGGGMPTRAFSVALDAARPSLVPEAGHRDFPFKVSESDPEVYYVTADASAYDVRWYLELAWSSGSRHGTVTVDDEGKPFRTSGNNGRPDYEFPLGGFAWNRVGAATATP